MRNNTANMLPPDFCDFITVFTKKADGRYTPCYVSGCKFSKEGAEHLKDIRGDVTFNFYARIPLGKCGVLPGDIVTHGTVRDFFKKEENGEDILKKYPRDSFRVKSVSFCGNHIYVKG